MHGVDSLLLDICPSKIKLYFFITLHVLATLSILFVSDYGLAGVVLKVFLVTLLGFNLKHCFDHHKQNIQIHLKSDNQADLIIANQQYCDLKMSHKSYISALFMQLVFLDEQTNHSHSVLILPDSIGPAMRSQLRSKLKYSFNCD